MADNNIEVSKRVCTVCDEVFIEEDDSEVCRKCRIEALREVISEMQMRMKRKSLVG